MDCTEFRTAYSEFADGFLDEIAEVSAHRHLSECPSCKQFHESYQWGVSELRRRPALVASVDFTARIERRIRAESSQFAPALRRWSGATAMLLGLTVAAGGVMVYQLQHGLEEVAHQRVVASPVVLLPIAPVRTTAAVVRPDPTETAGQDPIRTATVALEAFGPHRQSYTGQLTASWTGR